MLLLRNARIDGPPDAPAGEAVAVDDGSIVAVGADSDVRELARGAREVDVGGRRVIPGLIDSHAHVVRAGLTWAREVHWSACRSLREALALVSARAAELPAGTWIPVIGGWHPLQFEEGRGPTKADLDAAAPDHPCYVQLLYDEAVLNSAGLRSADLADSAPEGVVRGPEAFRRCLAAMGPAGFAEQVSSTRAMLADLAALGLTGALDAGGIGLGPDSYKPLHEVWREGGLSMRLRLYLGAGARGREREEIEDWVRFTPRGFGDDMLRFTGIGEILVFKCWDGDGLTPFTIDRESFDEFTEISRMAAAGGWPVHVHAVLDASAAAILDGWERVAEEHDLGALRFSLAHADAVSDDTLRRARALGIGVAVQNRMAFRASGSAEVWGEAAVADAPPLRRLLELGFPLGAGTDATVVSSINPWPSLAWLVTGETVGGPRRNPEHRLTRAEALRLYTEGSAWFSFEEHTRGRLAAGRTADLAVLSDDYFGVPDEEIGSLRSELTLCGGEVVHTGTDFDGVAAA
jgi:predicted amidohydrolase YtcJ